MTQGKILVVDDDDAIRLVIHEALSREGHEVRTAASVAEQAKILSQFEPDVLVTDVILPDGNGLDLVPEILARRPDLPVIVLSAQNTLATAVRATEQGAFEYLPKPFDLDELCQAVKDGLRRRGISSVQPALSEADAALPLIGRSPAMQEVYRTIARVVPNDLTVLILGESGTGKELVARAIHDLGPRKTAPFVAINMAAIPRDLIEAELFGHERGAFTGAQQRSAGRFEQAAGTYSWMKLAICQWMHKPDCCVSCNLASSRQWGVTGPYARMCALSRPRIRTCQRLLRPANFAKIYISG